MRHNRTTSKIPDLCNFDNFQTRKKTILDKKTLICRSNRHSLYLKSREKTECNKTFQISIMIDCNCNLSKSSLKSMLNK